MLPDYGTLPPSPNYLKITARIASLFIIILLLNMFLGEAVTGRYTTWISSFCGGFTAIAAYASFKV